MAASAAPSGSTRNGLTRMPFASAAAASSGDTPAGMATSSPPGRSTSSDRVLVLSWRSPTRSMHDVDVGDRVLEPDGGVVDELVRAELGEPVVAAGPGGADHVGAEVLGELDRQVPDTAGGGVDQHALPGPDVRGVHQGLPRGERGQRHRRGLLVADARRACGRTAAPVR